MVNDIFKSCNKNWNSRTWLAFNFWYLITVIVGGSSSRNSAMTGWPSMISFDRISVRILPACWNILIPRFPLTVLCPCARVVNKIIEFELYNLKYNNWIIKVFTFNSPFRSSSSQQAYWKLNFFTSHIKKVKRSEAKTLQKILYHHIHYKKQI